MRITTTYPPGKKLFKIDNTELFWIVGLSPGHALRLGRQKHMIDEWNELRSADVTFEPFDKDFTVRFEGPEGIELPEGKKFIREIDHWNGFDYQCTATVKEWLTKAELGDLIASTLY